MRKPSMSVAPPVRFELMGRVAMAGVDGSDASLVCREAELPSLPASALPMLATELAPEMLGDATLAREEAMKTRTEEQRKAREQERRQQMADEEQAAANILEEIDEADEEDYDAEEEEEVEVVEEEEDDGSDVMDLDD